ncbi:MAG: HIT family protein [Christensenellaceae bacterium]|jgi:diadenosine tetraphosphate (Ap4A) HIT family hydrolase|nr:HIT family protein [Christensenellaceae bacterium]
MCIFCDLKYNAIAENELCYAILDKFPQTKGHTLIIPKRHITTVFEMAPEENRDAFALINEMKSRQDAENNPRGYNIAVNCGEVAGQAVMHAHVHLIPRY